MAAGEAHHSSEHCLVCGDVLQYHERAVQVSCRFCGQKESGNIVCPHGHYVCEDCHNRDALRLIMALARGATETDPQAIAEAAFSLPGLPMLGCQHAFIAAAALMAALRNQGAALLDDAAWEEVLARTRRQAQGGYCGLTGVCGVVPAIGAVIAVLTGSRCGKDAEQRLTMEATARVSRAIAELTGPSCCKAYVRAALTQVVEFLKEKLGIDLPAREAAHCQFGPRHPHGCRTTRCPYFVEQAQGAFCERGHT